jgi:hypothetical protein
MTRRATLPALALAAALAACGSTDDTDEAAKDTAAATKDAPAAAAEAPEKQPEAASEPVPPPATEEPATAAVERGTKDELEKWKDHMGDVPFVIGSKRGVEAAQASGKPLLLFYTATW